MVSRTVRSAFHQKEGGTEVMAVLATFAANCFFIFSESGACCCSGKLDKDKVDKVTFLLACYFINQA